MNVEQLMTSNPATCKRSESMEQAASRMWEYDCGALPVLDDAGRLTGMITDRDICMAAYTQGRRLAELSVETGTSQQVFSVRKGTSVAEAERIMQSKQIRRIPVVDEQGRLAGILSLNDIARAGSSSTRNGVSEHEVAATLSAVCQPHQPPQRMRAPARM